MVSNNENLYIWDYEFVKLLYCVQFEKTVEPTAIQIINGLAIIIISANNGIIYFFHFTRNEKAMEIDLQLIGKFSMEKDDVFHLHRLSEDASIKQSRASILSQMYSPGKVVSPKDRFFVDQVASDHNLDEDEDDDEEEDEEEEASAEEKDLVSIAQFNQDSNQLLLNSQVPASKDEPHSRQTANRTNSQASFSQQTLSSMLNMASP